MTLEVVHVKTSHDAVWAFDTLNLFGCIGFIIILSTALLSRGRVVRSKAWYSFCTSWVINTLSFSLLLFAGKQTRDPNEDKTVPFAFCAVQASLVYSANVLVVCTTLAFVASIYLNMRTVHSYTVSRGPVAGMWLLVTIPYLAWIATTIGYLTRGLARHEIVISDGTYCSLEGKEHGRISTAISALVTVLCVFGEGVIIFKLRRNPGYLSNKILSLDLVVRLLVFSLFGVTTVCISLAFVSTRNFQKIFEVMLAAVPTVGALAFGTQKDIMEVWMFWKPPKEHPSLRDPHPRAGTPSSEFGLVGPYNGWA